MNSISNRGPLSPPSPNDFQSPSGSNPNGIRWSGDAHHERISPHKLKPQVDRSKADPTVVKAAEGMEAMFIDHMMQVMRQSVPKQDMDLDSPAAQIYQGMLDSEYAQKAARTGGIGLADLIIAYLDSGRYTLREGQGRASPEQPNTSQVAESAKEKQ